MNPRCAVRIESYEPIVAGWMRLECYADGWEVVIGHRHYAGSAGDCPPDVYGPLSDAELADVLVATVDAWGPLRARERS
jgi:hypothetical protein